MAPAQRTVGSWSRGKGALAQQGLGARVTGHEPGLRGRAAREETGILVSENQSPQTDGECVLEPRCMHDINI